MDRTPGKKNARRAVTTDEMKKQDAPIRIKRVYDAPDASDGARVLVDRLWHAVCAK